MIIQTIEKEMITYQPEKFSEFTDELYPLFKKHWKEISVFDKKKVPLCVDWKGYKKLEMNGNLLLFTVRDNGKLIGYYVAFVTKHLHYNKTQFANCDIIYLLPEYRKGLIGYKLIKKSEEYLIEKGVKVLIFSFKANKSLSTLMNRMGYKPLDNTYFKEV